MVVHNLNIARIFALPAEAEPPLVIDADAALTYSITLQCLQTITTFQSGSRI
jgi:hypothetical protein